MAVTSGFFNSQDGDRTYSAEQMGAIFEGIILPGIFKNVKSGLKVIPGSGLSVTCLPGRCWFNNVWVDNDGHHQLSISSPDRLLPRIDLVAIKIDKTTSGRSGTIEIVKGSPASSPWSPTPGNTSEIRYYPIAKVLVEAGATTIQSHHVTDLRGQAPANWITAPLESVDLSTLIPRLEAQFQSWFNEEVDSARRLGQSLRDAETRKFNSWYNTLRNTLSSNQAANLAARILVLETELSNFRHNPVLHDLITDHQGHPVFDMEGIGIQGRTVYRKA